MGVTYMVDFLEALKYLILGLIQGITEVIPVSSSAHVILFEFLLNTTVNEGLLFLILVNSGSLVAVLCFYSKNLWVIVNDSLKFIFSPKSRPLTKRNFIYALKIILATIPAGLVGVLFDQYIDFLMVNYKLLLSGVGLLFTGTMLYLLSQRRYKKGLTDFSFKEAELIGFAQMIAIVPGISRSGMTTAMAIKQQISVDSALRFSFMLYLPVSLGSLLLYVIELFSADHVNLGNEYILYYGLAFAGAFLASLFAFRFIYDIYRSRRLKYFGYYCFLIGAICIMLFASMS